ncbi:MAG TPA: hypothetical protein DDY78_09620 [Planctomycetales bacterium]|nr:hypothetical protein [Planctomycetales bacterium]
MALIDDVTRLAEDIRQGSAEVDTEIDTFPSGAVCLHIRVGERAFVLDYFPSYDMFGVDELTGDGGFNSGYRFGLKDFASAKTKLLHLLEEAQAPATAVSGSLPIATTSG